MLKPRDNSLNAKCAAAISTEAQMSVDCFLTTDNLLQTLQTGVLLLGVCVLTYLLTPWSRVLLEKLTSKLCC
jgi:hypothetical protein